MTLYPLHKFKLEDLEKHIEYASNGCWNWTASSRTKNGYGLVSRWNKEKNLGEKFLAHKVIYELLKNRVTSGMVLSHSCHNYLCVNPNHMQEVPRRVSALRGNSIGAIHSTSIYCKNGHLLDKSNIYYRPDKGTRQCKKCRYIRGKEASRRPQNKQRAIDHRRERIQNDENYRIKLVLRERIVEAIKHQNGTKSSITIDLIGCTIQELKNHLESKFYPHPKTKEVMTWENRGLYGWHIDHIIPCIDFNLVDPKDQKKCFHWTNLQPLWAEHNLEKSDKQDWRPNP